MTRVSTTMSVPPDHVWSVLADGWMYPLFVVGATRMRDVDSTWPEVGARIHHSVGAWPAVIDDYTEVLDAVPTERLRLRAKAWPIGEAQIEFELREHGEGTRVEISEIATSGPGRFAPPPLKGMGLRWRNRETLLRLAFVAEHRTVKPH